MKKVLLNINTKVTEKPDTIAACYQTSTHDSMYKVTTYAQDLQRKNYFPCNI